MERISEFRKTLLPVPVDPAMSRCGIWQRSETRLADQVLAEGESELRGRIDEFGGFDLLAQRDGLAVRVGHFDANRRFSRDALDQDRFGLEREAKIVRKAGDAAVLDAGFGLEFVSRDHRAGI